MNAPSTPAEAGMEFMTWPLSELHTVVEAMGATLCPLSTPRKVEHWPVGLAVPSRWQLVEWIEDAGRQVGMSCQSLVENDRSVAAMLEEGGPVLVGQEEGHEWRFLVLLAMRGNEVSLLAPDGHRHAPLATVERAIALTQASREVSAFCERVGVDGTQRAAVGRILGKGKETQPRFALSFAKAAAGAKERFVEAGGHRILATSFLSFLAGFFLLILSWWLLGRATMEGHLDMGWFAAWAILLQSFAVCRAAGQWGAGKLAVIVGGLLRERLLEGILRIPIEHVRASGVGRLLGKVMDADTLDNLSRSGGQLLLADVFQLGFGVLVLALGAQAGAHLMLLCFWLGIAAFLVRRLLRRMREWTHERLRLTDELLEAMLGYRTTLAQLPEHERTDAAGRGLPAYAAKAQAMDQVQTFLASLVPRGWLITAVLALAPGFALSRTASASMAVSLGGILFVYFALRRIANETGPAFATAVVAYQSTAELIRQSGPSDVGVEGGPALPTSTVAALSRPPSLLIARDLSFRYPERLDPVLRACDFSLGHGDHVLLVGPSGAGKSTLASLITGLRAPSGGLLLLGGFDHHSLHPGRWRQRAASVPQGHENHIFSASLLFNIAMARRWPPTAEDIADIEAICDALGLGEVVKRMPNGLQQMVGDSGWQLSQGERARVCVARALLQRAELRVLDESLAVLDPVTMDKVISCLLNRPEALVVVSHG